VLHAWAAGEELGGAFADLLPKTSRETQKVTQRLKTENPTKGSPKMDLKFNRNRV
jgi:hypothetical protein